MAQNQVYLIKSGENSFVEETQAIVGISGGKVGIGTTHPEADLHVTGSVKVDGDLTVDGTLTTINSSTVSVDDINIELGSTDSPTDATAEGGGITVKGSTNKTFNWHANGGWTSSENLSVADGKHFVGDELRALDAGGLNLFDVNQSGITIKGGKVGIHQTAPVYDLDVDGSGNFGSLYVDGNSVLTGEGSVFGKWEDGATAGEIFYTGGNVGVGITNPKHDFHVVGNGVVDGNFIVNGTSGTFNVSEFDVSGSNITLNSAGGGLGSNRGGLIVNGGDGTGKLEYLDSIQTWQSNQDIQIVADKHLQTDKVRAIDDGGLYLQDDGGNGIYIQDGGQVNIAGLTKADGGINVNGIFDIQNDGTLGSLSPNPDDVIKWNGTKWIASVSPGGGGGGSSEVPSAIINSLIADESIQEITYGPYDSTPRIATDLEIVGDGSVIPYALSGVSETGYFAVFSQEIPNNNYKIHTVFGGKDVYWETGSSSSIYYNDGDVSLQRNLTVGGNLTVAGNTTTLNTQTLEIEDHNIVIASNTGYNQLTDVYPVGGDYAGVFWGTGDAGAASPVSLTYQSNKGFAFEGGNIGIGTTSPGRKLQIHSNTGASQTVAVTTLSGATAISHASIGHGTNKIGNLQLGNASGNLKVLLKSEGDSYLIGGNVGIGTTIPSSNLHVSGANTGILVDMQNPAGNHGLRVRSGNNEFNDGSELVLDVRSGTSNNPLLNVHAGGNVGIGTTIPDSLVEVYSDSGVGNTQLHIHNDSTGSAAVLKLEGGRAATDENTYQDVGQVLFANKGNITAGIRSYHQGDGKTSDNSFDDGDLRFLTSGHESSNVLTPRMVIDSGGNVGIGTTSPKGLLDINVSDRDALADLGNAESYAIVVRNNTTTNKGNGIAFTNDDAAHVGGAILHIDKGSNNLGDLAFYTKQSIVGSPQERMRIDSDGNVGIGTTSPSEKLEVKAPTMSLFRDINNVGFSNGIQFKFGDSVSTAIAQSYASIGGVIENNTADSHNGALAFSTAKNGNLTTAEERVRIDSDGNVGIGTTNPGGKLQVNDFQLISGFTVQTTSGGTTVQTGADMRSVLSNGDSVRISGIVYTISNLTLGTFTLNTQATTNGSGLPIYLYKESLTIKDGNVGIGTTSPSTKLDIQNGHILVKQSANITQENILLQGSGYVLNANLYGNVSIRSDYSSLSNSGSLNFYTASASTATTERMRIASNGNVGIGTTAPISSAKLEVQGDSNGAAGIGIRHTGATAGDLWRMYMRNDSDLVISTPVSAGVRLGYGQSSWSAESDESLKDNISELGLVLDKVKNYRCINYSLISNEITEANAVGFIAQDWESDFPNVVSSDEDGKLSMKYTETIPVLLKAIQEQQQLIEQLKSQNESLATRISALES